MIRCCIGGGTMRPSTGRDIERTYVDKGYRGHDLFRLK
jgi:hypothetical protein